MKACKKICFFASLCLLFGMCCYAVVQAAQVSQALPVVVIDPGEGASFSGKDYHTATITISYPGQMKDVVLSSNTRQRGNGTINYDKKAYKIKLDETYDLLMGAYGSADNAARDWVLLADYYDRSNLRNYYMFFTAGQFSGFDFVPEGIFVEVYLIDQYGEQQYQGVYLLCEQVEVDEARVDIDDTTETEKGFLVELVNTHKQDHWFIVNHGETERMYDIRSQIDTVEDIERIQSVFEAAEAALATGDQAQIEAVIDIDSCVDMYILQEFMMNIDAGWASVYYYCPAGESKLYFAPPWDFDHSAGMDSRLYGGSYEGLYVGDATNTMMQRNLWYQELMQMDWFQQLVKERWNENKDIFVAGIAEIEGVAEQYGDIFQANFDLWRTEDEMDTIDMPFRGENYAEDAAYLFDWLNNRYLWLDDYFNTQL